MYKSEINFPDCDWVWSDIEYEVAYDDAEEFWSTLPDLYDVDGDAYVYEFRPLLELPTVYGVRALNEELNDYETRYFFDRADAEMFARDVNED